MSKKWAIVIFVSVLTVIIWSGWEVYKAFSTKKDVGEYEAYVTYINPQIDTDLVKKVNELQSKVLVKESEIEPPRSSE
ncbi:MAG: hypothetical protein PHS44_06900 [Candidatus Dojkabacteria bacterium]|jgi:hypothetical protein|nr:hypothetical protein [Candidatus Dojkabacteria bacterium]